MVEQYGVLMLTVSFEAPGALRWSGCPLPEGQKGFPYLKVERSLIYLLLLTLFWKGNTYSKTDKLLTFLVYKTKEYKSTKREAHKPLMIHVNSLTIQSGTSTKVITGSADNSLRLWDTETGTQLGKYDTRSAVRTCAFSYCGNRIMFSTDKQMGHACEILFCDIRDSTQMGGKGHKYTQKLL